MKNEELEKYIESLEFSFSKDNKLNFLNRLNENEKVSDATVYAYIKMLEKINAAEVHNGKEWFYFSDMMVDNAIVGFMSKSGLSLESYMSMTREYLRATKPNIDTRLNGYEYTISLTKNDLLDLDEDGNEKPEELKKRYINKIGEIMQILTEEEFDESILNHGGDYPTKCMAILLFNGIKGTGSVDLIRLEDKDVDVENMMVSLDGNVVYKIPKKYEHIFKMAKISTDYIVCTPDGEEKVKSKYNTRSKYFFKRTLTDSTVYNGKEEIDPIIITRQVKALFSGFGNPFITPTSIYNSGLTLRALKEHDWKIPGCVQLTKFREKYNVKLSYASVKRIGQILLDKLTAPCD